MKKISKEQIQSIPSIGRNQANEIALNAINEECELDAILPFLPFFDSQIADNVFARAIEKNISSELLLTAITPFTSIDLNDKAVLLAIKDNIKAEVIVGKAYPFVTIKVANSITEYAMASDCHPEVLLNAALPFVSQGFIDEIIKYAMEKNVDAEFLKSKLCFVNSKDTKEIIIKYCDYDNVSIETNSQSNEDILIKIFNDSGIEFDVNNYDFPIELDSLHYISIICEMEIAFDVEIPNEVLTNNKLSTFNDFLKLIQDIKGE